jgi:hypothetical protein
LLPLLGATEVPSWLEEECPGVGEWLRWPQERRPALVGPLLSASEGDGQRRLLSMVDTDRLRRICQKRWGSEHPPVLTGRLAARRRLPG